MSIKKLNAIIVKINIAANSVTRMKTDLIEPFIFLTKLLGPLITIVGILRILKEEYKNFIKLKNKFFRNKGRNLEINFSDALIYAFFCSLIGGFIWNFFFNGTLGGPKAEPHGAYAFLWGVVTNLPTVAVLMFFNKKYNFTEFKYKLIYYVSFLVGIGIGGFLFYDAPVAGYIGFRDYFQSQGLSPIIFETLLVFIWSSIISFVGFIFLYISRYLLLGAKSSPRSQSRKRKGEGMDASLPEQFLTDVSLVVIITSLAVFSFVITFPYTDAYHPARGIIAGLFLRITLFLNLFNNQKSDLLASKHQK